MLPHPELDKNCMHIRAHVHKSSNDVRSTMFAISFVFLMHYCIVKSNFMISKTNMVFKKKKEKKKENAI